MHHKRIFLAVLIGITFLSTLPKPAMAARGVPNSATFGYGARLDLWGSDMYAAVELAASMGIDWLAIDVDWARHWPSLDQPADFSALDRALQTARQKQISVMLSFNHAPVWALTSNGPEPNFTNAVLQSILAVYPDVIQAVELFPGVNSASRWGTTPNPEAYLSMLKIVRQGCDTAGRNVYLVTTVEPLLPGIADGSLDGQVFLDRMYNLGATEYMPIIGIRYPTLTGTPMTTQSELYPIVLRYYEQIRTVMLHYQHTRGLIWVTDFSWPTTGTFNPADPLTLPMTPAHQAQWIHHAIQLLRAQLFIGTAFFSSLNRETSSNVAPVLYKPGGSIHPASVTISQYAGGSLSSTTWTAPDAPQGTIQPSPTSVPAAAPVNFITSDGKPRK